MAEKQWPFNKNSRTVYPFMEVPLITTVSRSDSFWTIPIADVIGCILQSEPYIPSSLMILIVHTLKYINICVVFKLYIDIYKLCV